MPQEYSAGAIIFNRAGDTIKYLLLRYISENTGQPSYWGFAKGKIEAGEDPQTTAIREIEEETGLNELVFINDFQDRDEYFFKRKKPPFGKPFGPSSLRSESDFGLELCRNGSKTGRGLRVYEDDKYETVHKEVRYYLVKSKTDKVTLSHEHCDFAWLPYEEARERLTHKNSKEIIDKANKILTNKVEISKS